MHFIELSLGFKGERTYIHGSDMLNATMQAITRHAPHARIEKLDFRISKMTKHRLTCHWWPRSTPRSLPDESVASFTFKLDGIDHEGKLIQVEGCANTRRAYDESLVEKQCVFTLPHRSVSLKTMPDDFSPIEVLISMNKTLHLKELRIPSGSQWVFCRWESPKWPTCFDLSGVELTLEQTLGTRLTRSRIKLNAEHIGTLYFSALKVE